MSEKYYTIKELSELHSVSTRTIEKRLSSLLIKDKNKVFIPLDIVELLEKRHKSEPKSEPKSEDGDFDVIEGFTNEEYAEFQKRLIEYPLLLKDLEYHKKSAESHQRQMEKILSILEQRNYIEVAQIKLKGKE